MPFTQDTNQETDWYVFVSCASVNLEVARRVVAALRARGIRCWLYEKDIPIGSRNWLDVVKLAIQAACALVVVVTPDTLKSDPVHQELTLAYAFDKHIFPAWVEGDKRSYMPYVWESFRGYQSVELRGERFEVGMPDLVKRIYEVGENCGPTTFDKDLAQALALDKGSLFRNLKPIGGEPLKMPGNTTETLLRRVSDKSAVCDYLYLRIIRQYETIFQRYNGQAETCTALEIFARRMMFKEDVTLIANHLDWQIERVEATQKEGLRLLQEDPLLVAYVRDWLSLQ